MGNAARIQVIATSPAQCGGNVTKNGIDCQAISALNTLITVALSSVENLRTFDKICRPHEESDDSRRKRWCAFVWLEALQTIFIAHSNGLIDVGYSQHTLDQQLQIILKDDMVWHLVQQRGFDPNFVFFCQKIREKVREDKVNN